MNEPKLNIDLNPHDLAEVQAILKQHIPNIEVWAFGSRVKWTAKSASDLDLALITNEPLSIEEFADIKYAFDESDLPMRVDIVDWATTSESFRKIIEKDKVVVQKGMAWGMSFEWQTLPLDECLDALIDYRGKTPTKTAFGIPLVTAKVIKGGRIETPNEFIAEEDFDSWMRRGLPMAGDVVMTTEAPLGEVAQLGSEKVALAQRVITLRGKKNFLENDYLLYLFLSEEMQEQLKSRATGTTVLGIKQSELRKVLVRVPPLLFQKEAASILKSLDDRIALLRETNITLESITQALFKSWFVDFDPVHANAGTQAPSLPPEIQSLFPSTFVESPLGLVPEGWELGKLEDLLVLQRGFDLPSTERVVGDYLIIAASGPSGTHEKAIVKGPGVVTGRSGVLGKVFFTLDDYWPLNTTLWIKEFRRASPCFAFEILSRLDLLSFNAGSAVPSLNRNHVHGLPYLLPPRNLVDEFESIAMLTRQQMAENNKRIESLSAMRDTLLPRLISGQLRLPEVEDQFEAVLG